jgi:hypothetical protein
MADILQTLGAKLHNVLIDWGRDNLAAPWTYNGAVSVLP